MLKGKKLGKAIDAAIKLKFIEIVTMEALLVVFGIFGAYVLYAILTGDNEEKDLKHIYQNDNHQDDNAKESLQTTSYPSEDYNDERRIIREEIRSSIRNHELAINILQSLARSDGSVSEKERNQIFSFLQRNSPKLSYARHRPFFYGFHSGEWQRVITIPEFEMYLDELEDCSEEYKNDIYHTAIAIVASGGEPKKSEAALLELIKNLINKYKK